MNEREKREMVEQYLDRLDSGLGGVPVGTRRELLQGVREHIEEAWDASADHSRTAMVNILERVGDPEEVAREAAQGTSRAPEDLGVTQTRVSAEQAVVGGCSTLLVRLSLVILLLLGLGLIALNPITAAIFGTLAMVATVWGYRHRRPLGWGWIVVPAALSALWWGAALNHLVEEPGDSATDRTIYRATPVDLPQQGRP